VLLLFQRGNSGALETAGGLVPGHDGSGPVHLAFAIDTPELAAWELRLAHLGIEIESRVRWDRGGTSLYFRDPDGRSVELATPGIWASY
jgi:catechol 2,3-dioxygenase-like lactoylglutathione lyase family enzyme